MPLSAFIVWTLAGAGGRELAIDLLEQFGEPDAELGEVGPGPVAGQAAADWAARMQTLCTGRGAIVHCVEQATWQVAERLAVAGSTAECQHVFVYRREPAERLKAWHRAQRGQAFADADLTLPVGPLASLESRSARLLQSAWDFLQDRGRQPCALAFEDLLSEATPGPSDGLQRLFARLALPDDPALQADFRRRLAARLGQAQPPATAWRNEKALQGKLAPLPVFIPAPRLIQLRVVEQATPPGSPPLPRVPTTPGLVEDTRPEPLAGRLALSLDGLGERPLCLRIDGASHLLRPGATGQVVWNGAVPQTRASLLFTDTASNTESIWVDWQWAAPDRATVFAGVEAAIADSAADLPRYGSLRHALQGVTQGPADTEALEYAVLLDCRFRQTPAQAMDRLERLKRAAGDDDKSGRFQAFVTRLQRVLGKQTLSAHGYTLALSGRDAAAVWRDIQALTAKVEALGVRCFINSGTLLGAVREGQLIAHDDDVDLAVVLPADSVAEAAAAWMALKHKLARARLLNLEFDKQVKGHAKIGRAGGANVDLFPAWVAGGSVWVWPYAAGELPAQALLPLGRMTLGGVSVNVPHDPQRLLAVNYGSGWTRPDPSFRFDWSAARVRFADFLAAVSPLSESSP